MMKRLLLTGGRVLTGGELVETDVLLAGSRIAAVGKGISEPGATRVDLKGNILSPGFIDVHTHGGFGVDINAADSAEFDGLPGIGPYFAAKMVEYRERLGGYSFPEQLMDIYNFGEERYEALKDLVCCTEPEAFGLWTLPAEELRRHPYIRNWQTANAIVLYRENNPPDSLSVRGLASAGILSPEDAGKLARCRIEEVRASDGG